MIKITIDKIAIEDKFKEIALNNQNHDESIDEMKSDIRKLTDCIEHLWEKNALMGAEVIKLQNQIIELKTEETKERRSLWDFLKSLGKKDVDKTSRVKQTNITLTK